MAIDEFYWSQPQPRIVQYKKKRYALRLENVFWKQLEHLAGRRGCRLGQLIAELDAAHEGGANLSSFVRGFCMVEAEKDASRFRLMSGSFDLIDIMRGCPAPGLLLTADRTILEINRPAQEWVGAQTVLRQKKFDHVFSPRIIRSMDETIELMRTGQLKRTQIQIAYENRSAMATLTALSVGNIFYCLVWLSTQQQARLGPR